LIGPRFLRSTGMSTKSVNRALKTLIQDSKAYGHSVKGHGKRQAHKSARRVGKALSKEEV
jgi:hypothetical protein